MKPEHHPHRLASGTVRLGGALYGVASDIDDPHGWAWTALTLLDGTRTPEHVARELAEHHPELDRDDADGIVEALLESGHIEEADPPACPELTEAEQQRHRRTRDYFRWVDRTPRAHGWEAQVMLKRSSAVVVGLGGTGGHAAWSLAASGVGRLHLVDPDVVELSNLNRQVLYTEADVGRPKAEAAEQALGRVNSGVELSHSR